MDAQTPNGQVAWRPSHGYLSDRGSRCGLPRGLHAATGRGIRLDVLTEVPEVQWREFLDRVPGASIFQSPELRRVHESTKGYRPVVVAVAAGNEIQALLASTVISYGSTKLSRFTARAVAIGGPLGTPSAFHALLAAYDTVAGKLALLSQVRNLEPPSERGPFEEAGYSWEDHLDYLIDLSRGEAAVRAGMSKERRKGIAHAERSGLELVAVGSSEMPRCYGLLKETYSRAGIPLVHPSLFEAARKILGPAGQFWALAAAMDDVPVAVRLLLRYRETLFDWYAGSSEHGRSAHADEWLVWQTIRKGIDAGCTRFDFGGAGRPGAKYGPGEFKRRFGGVAINPGRFEKVYHTIATKFALKAYDAWRRLS